MKMYTTTEQTAKLIELGFEKPKGWYVDGVTNNIKLYVNIDENPMMFNYSIGELVEMLSCLPMGIDISAECVVTNSLGRGYGIYTQSKELIDALFEQIVKLKEEGVI